MSEQGPPKQVIVEDPQEPGLVDVDLQVQNHHDLARALPVIKDQFYEEVATEMMQAQITEDNIVQKTLQVMEKIEKDTTKTGAQKKHWVLAVMRKIIEISPLISEAKRVKLLKFVDETMPSIIDVVTQASNGIAELNKKYGCCDKDGCLLKCCSNCWTSIFPCFGGKRCHCCYCE